MARVAMLDAGTSREITSGLLSYALIVVTGPEKATRFPKLRKLRAGSTTDCSQGK